MSTQITIKNSILVLHPYKFYGQWVFDDESTGLCREAFIAGIDNMMDRLTENIPNAENGFNLLFSENEFPGFQITLDWQNTEHGGNNYFCREYGFSGWLCPALFKYFEIAPKTIYAQARESRSIA